MAGVATTVAALALAACGTSGHARTTIAGGWPVRHPVCLRASLAAIGRYLDVPVSGVSHQISTGNNAMPQCLYRAHRSGGQSVSVLANDEVTQAAYFVVLRTIDEAAQNFAPAKPNPPPVAVNNLGLESSWFPAEQWLISTDGYRVLTVSVDWPGASEQRKIALARGVTAPYLHTPRGKQAQRVARDFP